MKSESPESEYQAFNKALSTVAKAGEVSSRVAIEAAQSTKPSLHTRFSLNPAKVCES